MAVERVVPAELDRRTRRTLRGLLAEAGLLEPGARLVLRPFDAVWVARVAAGGAVVGMVACRHEADRAYLCRLVVAKERRRRGHGRRLVEAVQRASRGRRLVAFTSVRRFKWWTGTAGFQHVGGAAGTAEKRRNAFARKHAYGVVMAWPE